MSNIDTPTIYTSIPMQVYFITTVKKPFEDSILILLSDKSSKVEKFRALLALKNVVRAMERMPEPTKENTNNPFSHLLLDARDWYFKHCYHEEDRRKVIKAIFDCFIILYDYDKPWQHKMSKVFQYVFQRYPSIPFNGDKKYLWWRDDETMPFPWKGE